MSPNAPLLIVAVASLAGAAGVGLAAVAAHRIDSPALVTAANMLIIHAAAVVAISAAAAALNAPRLLWSAWLMLAAVTLFSGVIAVNAIAGPVLPGFLAPIGGSTLILSWIAAAILAFAARRL